MGAPDDEASWVGVAGCGALSARGRLLGNVRERRPRTATRLSWGARIGAVREEAPTRIELVCEALQASA
jgi:hypothetical protein